jgi:hypothetical protein
MRLSAFACSALGGSGSAHHVDTEAERASLISAGAGPWTDGEPEHVMRIYPARLWGHRISRI